MMIDDIWYMLKHWCFGLSGDISNGKSFISINLQVVFWCFLHKTQLFVMGRIHEDPPSARWCWLGRLTTTSGPWAPAVCSWKPGSFERLRSWETSEDRPPSTSSRRSGNSFPTRKASPRRCVGCFTKIKYLGESRKDGSSIKNSDKQTGDGQLNSFQYHDTMHVDNYSRASSFIWSTASEIGQMRQPRCRVKGNIQPKRHLRITLW